MKLSRHDSSLLYLSFPFESLNVLLVGKMCSPVLMSVSLQPHLTSKLTQSHSAWEQLYFQHSVKINNAAGTRVVPFSPQEEPQAVVIQFSQLIDHFPSNCYILILRFRIKASRDLLEISTSSEDPSKMLVIKYVLKQRTVIRRLRHRPV